MKRRALNFKTIVLIVVLIAVGLLILWLVTRKRIEGWTPLAGDYSKGVGDMSQAAGVTVAQAQGMCGDGCKGFVFVPNGPEGTGTGIAYFKDHEMTTAANSKSNAAFPGTVTYCKNPVDCGVPDPANKFRPPPVVPGVTPPVDPQPGGTLDTRIIEKIGTVDEGIIHTFIHAEITGINPTSTSSETSNIDCSIPAPLALLEKRSFVFSFIPKLPLQIIHSAESIGECKIYENLTPDTASKYLKYVPPHDGVPFDPIFNVNRYPHVVFVTITDEGQRRLVAEMADNLNSN